MDKLAISSMTGSAIAPAQAKRPVRVVASDHPLSIILLKYYELVDREQIDEVITLFAQTATYRRCEVLYQGIAEIENFYRTERKIRGRHTIGNCWVVGQIGIVEGVFTGKGVDESPKEVNFADFFTFDDEGKIADRHTYLMLGSSYVRD